MKDNNPNDITDVYKSLLKYFDAKGYLVMVPDGTISCVEVSNSPNNNVEIIFNMEMIDAKKNDSGKYDVYGKCAFSLAKTEETDPIFADQIMNDMMYFFDHFIGTTESA